MNATGALFALAGGGVAATGAILAAPIVLIAGGVLVVGVTGWCAVKSVPPEQLSPQDAVGDKFDNLVELGQFAPPLRRVGFVGASRAGKTTLLMHVIAQPVQTNTRTDDAYAVVSALLGKPPRYFALIDAAGQQYSQQFKVADQSEFLIVCLDHSTDDQDATISQERLRQHEAFLEQVLGHLKSIKLPAAMHFLLNKRDLWETSPKRRDLENWFDEQVARWANIPGIRVTSSHHSNFRAEDTTAFIEKLRQLLK